jgi:hypothetical protein
MKVLFLPEVQDDYDELEQILYEKGYFSFSDSSKNYVKNLVADIVANLPTKLHKPAPKYFNKYGNDMKYSSFRKNKNTNWYVFFNTYDDKGEIIYLVRYISNNHTIAHLL